MGRTILTIAFAIPSLLAAAEVCAACAFTIAGDVMSLEADCVTDSTIFIPDGMTLDGQGHVITAVDPQGGHFTGAVVQNAGSTAHVYRLGVTAQDLANVCDGGAARLRGIMFEGASGSITHCTVFGINQGPSGCQEGNAIEIRNAPFDGTHPGTVHVDVEHCEVTDYQKTGIVANGDVEALIQHCRISPSATQENLAANSVQIGFGATGLVQLNEIGGNEWKGTSVFVATAVLVFSADGTEIVNNRIGANSDLGIYYFADDGLVQNNKVFDDNPDHPNSLIDIGIGNYGADNVVTNNKIRGFDIPSQGPNEGDNKTIPDPQDPDSP